jgi:hypothetical protein
MTTLAAICMVSCGVAESRPVVPLTRAHTTVVDVSSKSLKPPFTPAVFAREWTNEAINKAAQAACLKSIFIPNAEASATSGTPAGAIIVGEGGIILRRANGSWETVVNEVAKCVYRVLLLTIEQ